MRRTFKIRFYCRPAKKRKDGKAPVEISIIVNGERQIFALPRQCEPEKFPTPDLKRYCTGVENKINEIYTALSIAEEPITAFILKDIYLNGSRKLSYTLGDMFADGLKMKAAQDNSLTAYRKYEIVRDYFYSITGYTANREAAMTNHSDILHFKAELDRKHKPATVEKEMMRLKYFFLLAFNSGKIKSNPFAAIKIARPQGENVFLTEQELETLEDIELRSERLDKIRDTFVFMCHTGLEYKDVANLKREDVTETSTRSYIRKKREKTGIEYITLLDGTAKELLALYQYQLPLPSNAKFNLYLKELSKIAKIDKNITTLTARHTFATMLLNRGIPLDIVSKALGHTSTRQTKTYAAMLDETVLNELGRITDRVPLQKYNTKQDLEDIAFFENIFAN